MRYATTSEILDTEQSRINAVRTLLVRYPGLLFDFDVNRARHLCARDVNAIADDVEFTRACGFCNDSPYVANPYVFVDGTRIYSWPRQFLIVVRAGHRHIAVVGWEVAMRQADISERIIARVAAEVERIARESH